VPRTQVLRDRGDGRTARVTNMELFFDLVYVFAFTQLSEYLYNNLGWTGALQTGVMFLAVWWSWNYTAWATGWIDPERRAVAALMAVLMVLSLLMASAIPDAFKERGLTLAIAYVAMQVLRAGFMVWAFGGTKDTMGRNYAQLLAWALISGVVWITGGLVHNHDDRLVVWAVAIMIDISGPMHGFVLPGAGRTPMADWSVAGGHLAERCQLVLMIAFGESVLRVGESFTEAHGHPGVDVAFGLGFALTLALWSLYFLHHAPQGSETMESAEEDAARMGRGAYAYAHAVMVGAVIVIAVAAHLAVSEPDKPVTTGFAAICLGGPALFLAGITLSKHWLGHGRPLPLMVGIALLVVLGAVAAFSRYVEELAAATLVSVVLAIWAQLDDRREDEVDQNSSTP
jgi:low temperature requirement protein LtrA